jgi:S-adenosylmethionine synthetase
VPILDTINIRLTTILARTAAYGHFGRAPEPDGGFSWEKTDLIDAIRDAVH